eukprot:6604622-Karenia_brevis.AAC.1
MHQCVLVMHGQSCCHGRQQTNRKVLVMPGRLWRKLEESRGHQRVLVVDGQLAKAHTSVRPKDQQKDHT